MPVRIESHMPHALTVPYPAAPGQKHSRYFTIPAATPPVMPTEDKPGVPGKPGEPAKIGVLELAALDSMTINRLRYHYERRPVDVKDPTGEQHEIGLLRIIITDEAA